MVLYKLCDALSQSLIRPFLVQKGYGDFDVGVATLSIGTAALLLGTLLGGLLTQWRGLGPGLWISGMLQVGANFGYAAVAAVGVNRPLMYAAQALEMGTSGMATGAFGVLLLRLTQKRFSATQYALLSSLFSLPRILGGPVAGVLAASIGWRDFFLVTVVAGIPGLWMLQRFVPWGVREPEFHVAAARRGPPLAPGSVWARGLLGVAGGLAIGAAGVVAAAGLKETLAGRPFDWAAVLEALLAPAGVGDWVALAGIAALGLAAGLVTVAALLARRGIEAGPQA